MLQTAVSLVLYGERLGLMLDYIDPEAQRFIDCITLMFKTTSPMLYIPPALLRRIGAKVWRDHVEAWDGIFNHGKTCSCSLSSPGMLHFQALLVLVVFLAFWCTSGPLHPEHLQAAASGDGHPQQVSRSPGYLALAGQAVHWGHQGQCHRDDGWRSWHGNNKLNLDIFSSLGSFLSIQVVKASWLVSQTSITLQWTLYELARHPNLQEELRAEVAAARAASQGDMQEMLKRIPLVKGALKETLRWKKYPHITAKDWTFCWCKVLLMLELL